MTTTLELPIDPALSGVMAYLDTESVLTACREQLCVVDSDVRRNWRHGRIIEALYHPGRYIRVAYAFLAESSIPDHRVWPQGHIVYVHAPVRRPMSRRGMVLRLGDTEAEVYRFPNDRRLRGLRKFTAQPLAMALWQQWIDQSGTDERLEPNTLQRHLLRYVPEQKWVVRLRAEPAQPASGKVHKRRITVRATSIPLCARLLNRHVALRRCSKESHARFHVARVVGQDAQLGLLAVKWAHGSDLFEMLQEIAPTDVMHRVASVLRSFHASSVPDLPNVSLPALRHQAQDALDDLSATCPELRHTIVELASSLSDRLDGLDGCTPVTLHNDLHWNQVRIEGERFTLLDFERMARGDPLIDVANLATQVHMLGHRPEFSVDVATTQRWAGEFLDHWERLSGERIESTRFRCYTVLSLLSLARGMMRHLRRGWRELARTCIKLAEAELTATNREVRVR